MRAALALLAALFLVGCGGSGPSTSTDPAADPEAVLRTWSDAMSTGDWERVVDLSCDTVDPEFQSETDESATALLDAASVRFELLQIDPAVVTGDEARIGITARYQLALDTVRLQASLGDALLAAGAPSDEIDGLATQAVEFLVAGARSALEQRVIEDEIPLVREAGAWRVCAPGYSPLTLAFPTAN